MMGIRSLPLFVYSCNPPFRFQNRHRSSHTVSTHPPKTKKSPSTNPNHLPPPRVPPSKRRTSSSKSTPTTSSTPLPLLPTVPPPKRRLQNPQTPPTAIWAGRDATPLTSSFRTNPHLSAPLPLTSTNRPSPHLSPIHFSKGSATTSTCHLSKVCGGVFVALPSHLVIVVIVNDPRRLAENNHFFIRDMTATITTNPLLLTPVFLPITLFLPLPASQALLPSHCCLTLSLFSCCFAPTFPSHTPSPPSRHDTQSTSTLRRG